MEGHGLSIQKLENMAIWLMNKCKTQPADRCKEAVVYQLLHLDVCLSSADDLQEGHTVCLTFSSSSWQK